jgi:hypothetical protein
MTPVPLTVIVTTYNHEAFAAQALGSVLAQETAVPFQVVVIDDASTDATSDIVRELRDRHPERVRVAFNEVNENSNRRFREEWERCGSEYVAVLDGDDYWTSTAKLARLVAVLEERPECAICFHDVAVVPDDPGHLAWVNNGPDWNRPLGIDDLWATNFIAGCSPLLRRSLLPRLPRWYDDLPMGDWPLYLLCADRGSVAFVDEVMGVYRLHAGGLWTGRAEEERLRQMAGFMEEMGRHMPRHAAAAGFQAARWRRALAVERRQAPLRSPELRRWLVAGRPSGGLEERLDAFVARHAGSDARVIRVQREPRRSWNAAEPLRLPPAPPRFAGWPVAEAPAGSTVLSWLAADRVYELSLHAPGSTAPPLARAATVGEPIEDRVDGRPAPPTEDPAPGEPFVRVEPVVVKCRRGAGAARVTWSTGDGSPGQLWMAFYPVTAGVPEPGEPSIAALEALREAGAEYLLVPEAGRWWLERDPQLRRRLRSRYRLVADERGLARLYDVREPRARARILSHSR